MELEKYTTENLLNEDRVNTGNSEVVKQEAVPASRYQVTSYRWAMLSLMFMGSTLLEGLKFTLVPMAVPVSELFGMTSTSLVNFSIFIFFGMAPIASLNSMWAFRNYRLDQIIKFAITI